MNRVLVASATAAVLLVASFATAASTATVVPARAYYVPFSVGSAQVTHRHVQKHPFYRSWGNHYGFGPGHHQY